MAIISQNVRIEETSERVVAALKTEKEELEATLNREQVHGLQLKKGLEEAEARNRELTKASVCLSSTLTSLLYYMHACAFFRVMLSGSKLTVIHAIIAWTHNKRGIYPLKGTFLYISFTSLQNILGPLHSHNFQTFIH